MTSEKRLREVARQDIITHLPFVSVGIEQEHPELALTSEEAERLVHLINTYPILKIPAPDKAGFFWPMHGRNYASVQRTEQNAVIIRGIKSLTSMTRAEALELASFLTSAAMEEA